METTNMAHKHMVTAMVITNGNSNTVQAMVITANGVDTAVVDITKCTKSVTLSQY